MEHHRAADARLLSARTHGKRERRSARDRRAFVPGGLAQRKEAEAQTRRDTALAVGGRGTDQSIRIETAGQGRDTCPLRQPPFYWEQSVLTCDGRPLLTPAPPDRLYHGPR